MSENIGWDRRLSVAADAKGIIGHVGSVLIRKCADRTGLTDALSGALWVSIQILVMDLEWECQANSIGGIQAWPVIARRIASKAPRPCLIAVTM